MFRVLMLNVLNASWNNIYLLQGKKKVKNKQFLMIKKSSERILLYSQFETRILVKRVNIPINVINKINLKMFNTLYRFVN